MTWIRWMIQTKHGFIFMATIYNHVGHTYCANWRGLGKAYGFKVGMSITFDIGIIPQYDPVTFPDMIKIFEWIWT